MRIPKKMTGLLKAVKANLILDHDEDDELLYGFIMTAIDYAERYQNKAEGLYQGNISSMPPSTRQAVIMLSSHFYENRDGSAGGLLYERGSSEGTSLTWEAVNRLLRMNKDVIF